MKKIYLFIILLFNIFLVNGQNWIRQYPFSEHETLYDIDFDTDGNGWAVGKNSIVLHTENSGVLWTSQTAPIAGGKLEAVEVVLGTNGLKGFAGGDRLLQTSDGGQTWLEVENGISSIRKIQSFDQNNIVVSGRTDGMRSGDGGTTWTEFSMPSAGASCAFFVDLNTGWAGAGGYNNDQVYKTTNGGQEWSLVNTSKYAVIIGFHFLNNNTGFMASRDWILKTTDAGITWDTLNPSKLSSSTDIHVVSEQEIWTSHNNGSYNFTKDGGVTWTNESPNVIGANSLQGIFSTNDGKVWTTGNYTSILFSEDSGDNWTDQVPGQKGIINKADFLNDKYGFAVGNEGIILKTTDGGAIWEDLSFQSIDSYFDVKILDQNQIFILSSGKLLLSSDGGINWDEKYKDDVGSITSFYIKSTNEIFITSRDGEIARSVDGGSTWNLVYNQTGYFTDIEFMDSQNAIVTGFNGIILKSSDGGLTWTQKRGDNSNNFKSITFVNNLEGWVAASNYTDTIFHTLDGGETFEEKYLGLKIFWYDVTFMDTDTGWIAGGSSGSSRILKTTDGGETWNLDYSGALAFRFIKAPIKSKEILWAGGIGGNILKFSPCDAAPLISALTGDLAPCAGDTIFYEVQQSGVDIFSWSIPDDWVVYGNSNTAKLEVIVGTESNELSVYGANSCGDSTAVLTLQVNPSLVSEVEISEQNEVLSTTMVADVNKYQWLRYGALVTGANSAVFAPSTGGKYSLEVTFNTGCIRYSNAIDVSITSAKKLNANKLKIFPNPANEQLFLGFEPDPEMKIRITDMLGVIHYSSILTTSNINISNLNEGIYIVIIESREEKFVSKLLIAR